MPRSGFLHIKRSDGKQYTAKTEVSRKLSRRAISKQATATLAHITAHETKTIFSNVSTRSATSSITASARSVTSTSRNTFSKIVLSPKNKLKDKFSLQMSRSGKRWQEDRSDLSSIRGMRRQKRVYDENDDNSEQSNPRESGIVLFATNESTIHAPIPRRLTSSSPPLELFDSNVNSNLKNILPWKRSLSSSTPLPGQVRAPYMSKKQKANLSKSLRTNSAGNVKSAWDRSGSGASSLHSGGGLFSCADDFPFNGDRLYDSLAPDNDSFSQTSNNAILHPAISPAYKFIPIGFSFESDCEDKSFCSEDYDICKEETASGNIEIESPASTTSRYNSHEINGGVQGNLASTHDSVSNSLRGEEQDSSPETMGLSTARFDDIEMTSFEEDTLKSSVQSFSSQSSSSINDQFALVEIEEMSSFEMDNLHRLNGLYENKEIKRTIFIQCSSSVAETASTQESETESLVEIRKDKEKQNRSDQADGYQWLLPIIQLASTFSINCGS
mmetsp:Transcript_6874/g.14665  ORF Transcript_6874/g.14665 Transcript_6874/m.14665 type:complete len:500 (-) Transcript_6874:83-1582(-)